MLGYWIDTVIGVLGLITSVLGLAISFVTIFFLTSWKDLNQPISVCIVNLAICDFLYCSMIMPFRSMKYLNIYSMEWMSDCQTNICQLVAFIRYLVGSVGWAIISVTALERYMNFKDSIGARTTFRGRYASYIIVALWVVLGIFYILPFYGKLGCFVYDPVRDQCDMKGGPHVFVFTALPLFITIVVGACHILIRQEMSEIKEKWKREGIAIPSCRMKSRKQAVRTSFYVFVVPTVCYMPMVLANLLNTVYPGLLPQEVEMIFYLLYWQNYYLNIAIYIVRISFYRKACAKILQSVFPYFGYSPAVNQARSPCTPDRFINNQVGLVEYSRQRF